MCCAQASPAAPHAKAACLADRCPTCLTQQGPFRRWLRHEAGGGALAAQVQEALVPQPVHGGAGDGARRRHEAGRCWRGSPGGLAHLRRGACSVREFELTAVKLLGLHKHHKHHKQSHKQRLQRSPAVNARPWLARRYDKMSWLRSTGRQIILPVSAWTGVRT